MGHGDDNNGDDRDREDRKFNLYVDPDHRFVRLSLGKDEAVITPIAFIKSQPSEVESPTDTSIGDDEDRPARVLRLFASKKPGFSAFSRRRGPRLRCDEKDPDTGKPRDHSPGQGEQPDE